MHPCPHCQRHVRLASDGSPAPCRFCGTLVEARRLTGAALLLGLALGGCRGTEVPLYGAPATDLGAHETADTGTTGDTGAR